MSGVKNRVALVTGAGSANGIGYATANLLRAAGAKVAITSTTERIYQRLEEMGGTAEDTYAITADLTDTKSVKSSSASYEFAPQSVTSYPSSVSHSLIAFLCSYPA